MDNKYIKDAANKIVDRSYKNTKHKNPFTQVAENAVKELSYGLKDGLIENKEGSARTNSAKEAIEFNELLDKNFQDQKRDDYLARVAGTPGTRAVKPVKRDTYRELVNAKVSNPPILQKNINDQKIINPTVAKYKAFKEKQQKKIEDKKFDENFEKEYGDRATRNYVRAKVNKNKREGKRDYENLSINDIIVNEDTKDRAKERLELYKKNPVQLPLPHIDTPIESTAPKMPDFKTFMKSMGPTTDPDLDAGIAGLDEIKNFKKTAELADQKFPKKSRGIGPFLTGEED